MFHLINNMIDNKEKGILDDVEELVSDFIKKTGGIPGKVYESKKINSIIYARVRNNGDGRELWRARGPDLIPYECSVKKFKNINDFIKNVVMKEDIYTKYV